MQIALLGIESGSLFAVNEQSKAGKRRDYCIKMCHGVSRISDRERFTISVIFHDAK